MDGGDTFLEQFNKKVKQIVYKDVACVNLGGMKAYGQYCSVARALDVIGDRWTLLIIRELTVQGPCRYTDLRNGLPGIATNLLSDRLRALEQAGVIAREEAPPPIATTLFSLTPRGEELEPVLDALHRWGMPLMAAPAEHDVVRSHWLAGTLDALLADHRPSDPPATVAVVTGDQPILIELASGEARARIASVPHPDATVSGPARETMGLLLGRSERTAALAGGVTIAGDPSVLDRLRAL